MHYQDGVGEAGNCLYGVETWKYEEEAVYNDHQPG